MGCRGYCETTYHGLLLGGWFSLYTFDVIVFILIKLRTGGLGASPVSLSFVKAGS
ncbi:MAG: hypothetical protein FWE74_06990 [Oscillospiraceae bacterium]|nr:hypothetical protein [Oscillospiraceae bacterium]